MARINPKKKPLTKIIDHALKLVIAGWFVITFFIPGLVGFLGAEINTADVPLESFIFATVSTGDIEGIIAVMIAMGRMLIALAVVSGLYRDNVSDLLGLELYGPRMVARLLFMLGVVVYLIAVFISWLQRTGGL